MRITVNGMEEISRKFRQMSDRDVRLPLYILSQIAGQFDQRYVKPNTFGGKLNGFGKDSGDTQARGLHLSLAVQKKGFTATLSSPMINLYNGYKRRPKVDLLGDIVSRYKASNIAEEVTERAYQMFLDDRIGPLDYLNMRSRKKRSRR